MAEVDYAKFEQVQCERDLSSGNFTKGQQNFMWESEGIKSCNFYRSYFRGRFKLTKGDDTQLDTNLGVGPNMFMMDNLYQQCCLKNCGKDVSSMQDYIPQLGALKKRMQYNNSMLDTLGKQTMYSQADINERINDVSSNGFEMKKVDDKIHPGDQTSTLNGVINGLEVALDLGFDAANSFDIVAASGVVNFTQNAAPLLPDVRNVFNIGDIFVYRNENTNVLRHGVIIALQAANAITIRQDQAVAVSADQTVIVGQLSRISSTESFIIGANTLFTTELEIGDEILINDNERTKVKSIISDIEIRVSPRVSSFQPTANWFRNRKNQPTRRVTEFELTWKPPLGIFEVDKFLYGKWKLELMPIVSSSIQQYVVETLTNLQPSADATGYKFEVVDLLFYPYTGYNFSAKKGTYDQPVSFTDCRAQSQNLTTNSLTDKTFVVNPNTHSLTLFYQDEKASSSDPRFSRSKFKIQNDEELNLTRFYLKYLGTILPNPIPDPLNNGTIDYITQNYYEQLVYSGSKIYNSDVESLQTWKDRGIFFHYRWPKSQHEKTERVYVSSQFSALTDRPQVFLIDHFTRSYKTHIVDGYVKSVSNDESPN